MTRTNPLFYDGSHGKNGSDDLSNDSGNLVPVRRWAAVELGSRKATDIQTSPAAEGFKNRSNMDHVARPDKDSEPNAKKLPTWPASFESCPLHGSTLFHRPVTSLSLPTAVLNHSHLP